MESGTTIAIAVGIEAGLLKMEIKAPGNPLLRLPLKCTPGRLEELRSALSMGLGGFVTILAESGAVDKSPRDSRRALQQLYSVGAELGFGIFGSLLDEIGDYLRTAVPGWAGAGRAGYAPPAIILEGSLEHPLPLEFVPLFDTSEPVFPALGDASGVAARFPVFSTLFCRSPISATRAFLAGGRSRSAAAKTVIENASPMLVRLFTHEGLEGAAAELDFFRGSQGAQMRGPWPDAPMSPADFVEGFSNRVLKASDPGDATHPQTDDVQHFICHCDTGRAQSRDYALLLAHRARRFRYWSKLWIHSATLKDLQRMAAAHALADRAGPLVFLNACGSSKITPEGVTSFPDLFLETGSCAVIGTEVGVPDLAAAEFAKAFYTQFMAGKSIGEALYEARAELMRRSNPVGAIYSAYSHPELRLRNPVSAKPS